MICPDCNKIELTYQEENDYKRCMKCMMVRNKYFSDALNAPNREIDPTDFGRDRVQYETFEKEIKTNKPSKPQLELTRQSPIVGLPDQPIDKQFDRNLSSKKFVVNGVNEDIKLTLELPEAYPIHQNYYADTKKIMEHCLTFMIHYLAYAPLVETPIEKFLAERFKQQL